MRSAPSGSLAQSAARYIETLTACRPHRRTGSSGNREAVSYFADVSRPFGYHPETKPFPCLDWRNDGCVLAVEDATLPAYVSPYSPGCEARAPIRVANTVEQLEETECTGCIMLLWGEIASEQLMPKGFPFYNPDSHRRLYALIEEKHPAALVTATGHNPEVAGALDPYPMFVDGDFDIPSVYCTEETGARIAHAVGRPGYLAINAARSPATASNIVIHANPAAPRRVLVTAHIDTYEDTPGAYDNASGTAVLLLLAQLLATDPAPAAPAAAGAPLGVEIVALNGEDHYSAAGQLDYLRRYGGDLETVAAAINIDGVGYREGGTAYSFYEMSPGTQQRAARLLESYPGMNEGAQWPSGDHMVFVQQGVPALAFTAERTPELLRTVAHTAKDTPDLLDYGKLVELARTLRDVIPTLV